MADLSLGPRHYAAIAVPESGLAEFTPLSWSFRHCHVHIHTPSHHPHVHTATEQPARQNTPPVRPPLLARQSTEYANKTYRFIPIGCLHAHLLLAAMPAATAGPLPAITLLMPLSAAT